MAVKRYEKAGRVANSRYTKKDVFLDRFFDSVEAKSKELEAALGPGLIEESTAGYLLIFDRTVENIVLVDAPFGTVRLHDLLAHKDRDRQYSKVNIKVILFLEKLWEEYAKRKELCPKPIKPPTVSVVECYRDPRDIRGVNGIDAYRRERGCIVDLKLSTRNAGALREFHRAIRRVGLKGGITFDGPRVQVDVSSSLFHRYVV